MTDPPPSTFHHFPLLPPELRLQIWQASLPAQISDVPALFNYAEGGWQPRKPNPNDGVFYDEHKDDPDVIIHEWDPHAVLYKVPMPRNTAGVALFFVNREARSVVMQWLSEMGISIRRYGDFKDVVLMRGFIKDLDALYISDDKWSTFITEGFDSLPQEVEVNSGWETVRNVAILESILKGLPYYAGQCLAEAMHQWTTGIRTVYVILNNPASNSKPSTELLSNFVEPDHSKSLQPRWEFDTNNTVLPVFYWTHEEGWVVDNADEGKLNLGDESLFESIKIFTKAVHVEFEELLGEDGVKDKELRFEVRPVFARKVDVSGVDGCE